MTHVRFHQTSPNLPKKKKSGATECELHRKISLMIDITFKNHNDASQKQNQTRNSRGTMWVCEGKYTTNAISTLRIIIDRALEVHKEVHVYLCFIDYIKAFDRVRHVEIITQLT